MLHLFLPGDFLTSNLGTRGLIGNAFQSIPLIPSLLLLFVVLFAAYLIGSINTAIIVSGKIYHDDIRNYGSGNAGFTNIMRIYGKRAAIITFVCDFAKTVVAIMIGWCYLGYLTATVAGFMCFLGHIFPLYYRFRGGKGILCLTAMLFMLEWRVFLILLVIFLLIVKMTKYISFGSILGGMLYPLLFNRMNSGISNYFEGLGICQMVAILVAVIVVIKHWPNLKRIFNGTESKFEFKRSKKEPDAEAAGAEVQENPEESEAQKPARINYGALPGTEHKNQKKNKKDGKR